MYKNEGYQLVGCAFEVYRHLGGGMAEEIYQESMEIELGLNSITYLSKPELTCSYKKQFLKRKYFPDLVVYDGLIVELKAVSELTSEHVGQIMNYMRISNSPVGYLLNFGKIDGLQWKRLIIDELLDEKDE